MTDAIPALRNPNHSLVILRRLPHSSSPHFVPLIPVDLLPPLLSMPAFPRYLSAIDVAAGGWTCVGSIEGPEREDCIKAWRDGGRIILGVHGADGEGEQGPWGGREKDWGGVVRKLAVEEQERRDNRKEGKKEVGRVKVEVGVQTVDNLEEVPLPPAFSLAVPEPSVAPAVVSSSSVNTSMISWPSTSPIVPLKIPVPPSIAPLDTLDTPTPSPLRPHRYRVDSSEVPSSIESENINFDAQVATANKTTVNDENKGDEGNNEPRCGRSREPREQKGPVEEMVREVKAEIGKIRISEVNKEYPSKKKETAPRESTKKTGLWNSIHSFSTAPSSLQSSFSPLPSALPTRPSTPCATNSITTSTTPLDPAPISTTSSPFPTFQFPHPLTHYLPPTPQPPLSLLPQHRRTRRGGRHKGASVLTNINVEDGQSSFGSSGFWGGSGGAERPVTLGSVQRLVNINGGSAGVRGKRGGVRLVDV